MNVLFRYDGFLPVKRYGGTERIIFWLMKELVKKGIKVSLIARPGSDVSKYGIELITQSSDDWRSDIPKDTDIIHLFEPVKFELDLPCIFTIGGNGQIGEGYPLNTVFVSKKHAVNHNSNSYVYNGIDLEEYPYIKRKKSWNDFIFLAKARWRVKNLRHCVKACRKARKYIHICGGRSFSFSRYIKSYGMVDQEKKNEILNKSDALLFPVRWHEPFGIAIVEAMAAGLPVIGSPYGSLPELIQKGTGVICRDYNELYQAISSSDMNFDSDYIRSYVEDNFSSLRMAEDYISIYSTVISGEKLNRMPPTNITGKVPEYLLAF